MKYTKYDMGSYNLHIINTPKFKTISIKIYFKRKIKKEEITIRNLLNEILCISNKNFPSNRLLAREIANLYGIKLGASSSKSGNYLVSSFISSFLNEKYTEEGMNEKSFKFIFDVIFNPNVTNSKFDTTSFNIAKKIIANEVEASQENKDYHSKIRMLETMDKDAVYAYHGEGYKEDLDKINEKNLYEYYKSMLKSDLVDVFIIGDVDSDKLKNFFKEKFPVNTIKKTKGAHFLTHQKFRSRSLKKIEKTNSSQSKLAIGCKIDNKDPFMREYVSRIYNFILGSGPESLLFQNIREKNSLAYSVSSSVLIVLNLIIITAGIDKKSFNKTIKIVKDALKQMEKGEFSDEDIENAKINYTSIYDKLLDDPFDIINIYVNKEYLGTDDIETMKKEIKNVNREMIINFAKKVHLDTIFLLEGGDNIEKD